MFRLESLGRNAAALLLSPPMLRSSKEECHAIRPKGDFSG
jgi:hypothetical protein